MNVKIHDAKSLSDMFLWTWHSGSIFLIALALILFITLRQDV